MNKFPSIRGKKSFPQKSFFAFMLELKHERKDKDLLGGELCLGVDELRSIFSVFRLFLQNSANEDL